MPMRSGSDPRHLPPRTSTHTHTHTPQQPPTPPSTLPTPPSHFPTSWPSVPNTEPAFLPSPRYDPKWKDREPPTPESLQMHLETRFAQLSTAITMELWQEAYRTVEDVHSLITQMKKPPKPTTMAGYHAQLAEVFHVADNQLFHAYALTRLYSISRSLKAVPSADEMQKLASRAVLAALAIPPSNPVLDVNLLEYDLEHEKTKRMASMLSFPLSASRAELLEEVQVKGLLAAARPEVAQLFGLFEQQFYPLDLAAKAAPLLAALAEDDALAKYDGPMRRLCGLRMLQQMERIYLTIRIEHAQKVISLLSWQEIETLILWAVKRELLTLRIDYKSSTINQRASKADATASSEVCVAARTPPRGIHPMHTTSSRIPGDEENLQGIQ